MTLSHELDFEREGKNGEKCQADLAHLGYIHVPEVHWKLTGKVCTRVIIGML